MNRLLFFVFFPCFVLLHGEELISYGNRLEKISLHPAGAAECTPIRNSNGTEALKVLWGPALEKEKTVSIRALPICLSEFETAEFSLSVYVPSGCSAEWIRLLLQGPERKNTVLQAPVPSVQKSGWQTLKFFCKTPSGRAPVLPELRIVFRHGRGSRHTLLLGKLEVQYGGLLCSLNTGSPVGVLDLSRRKTAELILENRSASVRTFDLSFRVTDSYGKILDTGRQKVSLHPGEKQIKPFRPVEVAGVYHVDCSLSEQGRNRSFHRRFAAMVPAESAGPLKKGEFLFSICSHSLRSRFPEIEKEIELMRLCGARHTRNGFSWPEIQPEKEVFNWIRADHFMNLLEANNLALQTAFIWAPAWAVRKGREKTRRGLPCPDFDAYRNYARTLVRHYRGRIRFYEVWNEPDISDFAAFSAEEYTQLQRIAYEEVKKADPEALVLAGGFGNTNGLPLQKVVFTQAPDTCDIIAYHEHGIFSNYTGPIERVLKFWRELKVKQPWFANETAVSSAAVSENEQAVTLFKKLIYSWSRGSIGYTWYNLRNKGWNPKNGEHNFGMVTMDFQPKPVYVAFNALASLYRGARLVAETNFRNDLYSFRFQGRGYTLYPVWSERKDQDRQLLVFQSNADHGEFLDLMGNSFPLKFWKSGGKYLLVGEVDSRPGTIRLPGEQADLEYCGVLVESMNKLRVDPGEKRTHAFRVWNPYPQAQNITLELSLPEGLKTPFSKMTGLLAPGERKCFAFEFEAAKNFSSSGELEKAIHLAVRFQESGIGGRIRFPLHPAISLSARKETWQRIGEASSKMLVQSLVEAKPSNQNLFWKGPSDLSMVVSARIVRGSELQFIVAVIDDVHHQTFHGHDLFRGDSLQLMLQLPGQNTPWEIGAAVRGNGEREMYLWNAPPQFRKEEVLSRFRLHTAVDSRNALFYTISLPLKVLGTSCEELKKEFSFNVMANDNDGPIRESFISLIPGDPKNVNNFRLIVVE